MLDFLLLRFHDAKTKYFIAGFGLIFLAFLTRVYRLDAIGFEGDEAFSIKAAYSGFTSILQLTATAEPHPPLYYSSLRVWYMLAGASEFALRYPSVLANVLTVAFLLRVANLFSWRMAGLIGAVLLILNPYQIWYAQETRMYAPVALFGIIAIYFALQALRSGSSGHLTSYVLFMLLSLYSHYYAIFLFGFVNLLFLAMIWRQREGPLRIVPYVIAQVVVAALFLPWLAYAYHISLSYTPFARGTLDLVGILKESLVRYSLGISIPMDLGFDLSLGFLVIVIVGLWFAGRTRNEYPRWFLYLFAAGYLLIPIVVGFLVSTVRPMFAARYLMVSAPAFYLLLGVGVVALYKRIRLLGVAAAVFMLAAELFSLNHYYFDPNYVKTDFPSAIAYIQRHARPGDAILLDGWSQTLQLWYYNTLRAKNPMPSYLFPLAESNGWDLTPGKLDEIMHRHQGVWLLDYDIMGYDPGHIIETYLAKNHYQALTHRVELNRTVYYASAPSTPLNRKPLNVSFDQDLLLKDFGYVTTQVRPGDFVPLSLDWQALKSITKDYAISWRLMDPDGHIVLQRDSGIASGFFKKDEWTVGQDVADNYEMPVPSSLPPGRYSLAITVYDKVSGATSRQFKDGKDLQQALLPLGQIEVVDEPPVDFAETPTPSRETNFKFGALDLLGYDSADGPFKPGDTISIKLYWQAMAGVGEDYRLVARFLGEKGEVLGEKELGLGPSWFPTSRWRRGRLFTTYVDVPVPARASTGKYSISLVARASEGRESTLSDFARISVISRERVMKVPPISFPATVKFGDLIELLGYDLTPNPGDSLAAGQEIHLKLHWRALQEMADSYKVFVHLVGEDGQLYGQKDSIPLDGKAPTNSWVAGEVISDAYDIAIRPTAPAGKYRVVVGLYEEAKGNRVPLADGSGDSYTVGNLIVTGAPR